jgi:hypothetical protein
MSNEATKTAGQQVTVAQPPKPPLIGGGRVSAIVPQDFEGAYRLATVIFKAKMAPKSLDSVEKITVAIMHGMEVGFTPMAAIQSIAVVNGSPAIWGDGMLALIENSGLLEDKEELCEIDDKGEPSRVVCRVKRVGRARWYEQTFTQAEAIKAGLWNKQGPWVQYRRRMMMWRVRGWALRDAFPDVLRGLRSAEEALDSMVDITPRAAEPTREQFKIPRDVTVSDAIDASANFDQATETGGQPAEAAQVENTDKPATAETPHDTETGEILENKAEPVEEPIAFNTFRTFSGFYDFSADFLNKKPGPAQAKAWHAFYCEKLAGFIQSAEKGVKEKAEKLLELYGAATAPKGGE